MGYREKENALRAVQDQAERERMLGDPKPYGTHKECPKCGAGPQAFFLRHCSGSMPLRGSDNRCHVVGEHLHCFCGVPGQTVGCGYAWLEWTKDQGSEENILQ